MRVVLDEDRCIAGGQCVLAAPEVFDQREDDGIGVVLAAEPAGAQADDARKAAALCPAAAIAIEE
jgi:ferredoxin